MGLEFIDIFEDWAEEYDKSVAGLDPQYAQVFANYKGILQEVVNLSSGTVLEFGVGTGNLSTLLIEAGHKVIGIEPSKAMRDVAKQKHPNLPVLDGDFIAFPKLRTSIDTIVSTYAFHHLTDDEKKIAVKKYHDLLLPGGKVVFGDTMFTSKEAKELIIEDARNKGHHDLVEDLNREYYPTIDVLHDMFTKHSFNVSFKQMNDFVWIMEAEKQ
ncbi:class I SAM-dependent DNA methyltransferase [Oceanobacillus bengalensis]|uniref:Uncharacterized methyltransferase D8M05_01285 n=1 Tax=Oceanobacillus bengalensis TaxID=1435466 RepID=A0A494Z832_9BACI|nr:class I SAM-dependent methyltransferase [Oceanobacillus bengalensis]RKQ18770.1 class I SAM-dependent methyltransferase [Oceanobacillus bengalensis]